ncbi:hypothetical protein ACOZ4N_05905 [Halorientalis pallida]|uniref:hypothetical protein n=1 Tax=Halorientalis pallida TaxID=2479928 RepID=UPI003C6F1FB8
MDTGVLYVATGDEYVAEAKRSAETLRDAMPDVSVTLVTDGDLESPLFDRVIRMSDPAYSYVDKITGMELSPYDRTVFLDTDVYVADAVDELFEMLDGVDIAAAVAPNRDLNTTNPGVPASFPEYNTGVLPYTDAASDLLDEWKRLYQADHKHDQPAFREAAYESDLRIATLPREYNCLYGAPGHLVNDVKILHGNIAYTEYPSDRRFPRLAKLWYWGGAERVLDDLNSCSSHRHYHRHGSTACRDVTTWNRFVLSVRRHGLGATARRMAAILAEKVS